jgi:hypothetical protein
LVVDHVAFMSTNYLPIVGEEGDIWSRQPMLESLAFEA